MIINSEDIMFRFKSSILFVVLMVLIGCSSHVVESPQEQEAKRAEQKEDQRPPAVPTFTYRPGAGLAIEGR